MLISLCFVVCVTVFCGVVDFVFFVVRRGCVVYDYFALLGCCALLWLFVI